MSFLPKLAGMILAGALALYILKQWILIPIGIIIVLWIIRFVADIYWKGKDDGKW
jgi:uncharacterized membrane protein YGL010W